MSTAEEVKAARKYWGFTFDRLARALSICNYVQTITIYRWERDYFKPTGPYKKLVLCFLEYTNKCKKAGIKEFDQLDFAKFCISYSRI